MSSPDEAGPAARHKRPLTMTGVLVRVAVIAVVIIAVVGAFAYVGGWLSPSRLSPRQFTDTFEQVNEFYPGFRRNHAKGLCLVGHFEGNGRGARLSKATVFARGRVAVMGRFALAGGQPYAADSPSTVRSMALRFALPEGEEWRTGMNNIPVFPFATPEAFYDQLATMLPDPATGKPDPARMQTFLAAHPETVRALSIIDAQPISSGFDDATYHGLNAFHFVDEAGKSVPVRWSMVPLQPFVAEDAGSEAARDMNYLFDHLIVRVPHQPLQWRLVVTVAQPGDPTHDATIGWPPDRERVEVGTLTVSRVEGEDRGDCRDINFDPLVLPAGIEPSDDPLLSARSAVYSESFTRRVEEDKLPSAIQTDENEG